MLTKVKGYDFAMQDYTSKSGKPNWLCGNESRCSAMFAKEIGIVADQDAFLACDGPHDFSTVGEEASVKFADVKREDVVKYDDGDYSVDVGSLTTHEIC